MPKVGKLTFKISGENRVFDLWYKQDDGFTIKGFPSEIERIANKKVVACETAEALEEYVNEILEEYHVKSTQTSRWLSITVNTTSHSGMNQVGEGNYQGRKKGIPEWFGTGAGYSAGRNSRGFTLSWQKLLKIEGKEIRYHAVDDEWSPGREEMVHRDREDSLLMVWTQEREMFLNNLDNQIDQMILKIGAFFMDDKQLIAIMDSGIKLSLNQ